MPFVRGPRPNWNLGNIYMSARINNFQNRNPVKPVICNRCYSDAQVDLTDASACVLSCIDFRLRDNKACHLNELGYRNNYDETSAAGASLGYNGLLNYNDGPTFIWSTYIDNHITLAYDLHNISKIIIVEHEQCGAYAAQYPDYVPDGSKYLPPPVELQYQLENIEKAGPVLWDKFNPVSGSVKPIPNLEIIGYRISIDACTFTKIYYKNSDPNE